MQPGVYSPFVTATRPEFLSLVGVIMDAFAFLVIFSHPTALKTVRTNKSYCLPIKICSFLIVTEQFHTIPLQPTP